MDKRRKLFESWINMARIVVDMKRSNDPMQEYADLEVEWLWAAFKQGWDDLKHQQHLERFRDGGQ